MITTLCNIITGGALTFFFVNYFGMNAKLSATCWMLFGLWNAVNDPLFGYISDKTKSKLGRRIPYIRYGAVLIAAIFVLSWVVWFDTGSDIQMFIQIISVLHYKSLTNDITSGIILLAIFVILIFRGHHAKTNQEY